MALLKRSPGHALYYIQPGLWQIVFNYPATTNCWLWQEKDGLTLVDAGHPWNTRQILDAAATVGSPIRRIVLTHGHPDHAGAAAELARLTSADVFAHEAEMPYLAGQESMADLPGFWMCCAVLNAGRLLHILSPPRVEEVKPVVEGDTVGRLQVIHTPGHTPGSMSLWSDQEHAVFCGDNVCASRGALHIGLPWFTLDLKEQKESVGKYAQLPAGLLLSGHGPVYRGDVGEAVQRLL